MSLNEAVEAIPRKTLVLFFLIDTSGSMAGAKIGAVNTAIEEVIPELKEISAGNADAEIKIAALEFASTANWLTGNGPVPVDNFIWQYADAGGNTSLGEACLKLNDALSTKTFMRETVGSFAPAVILLSDGEPTDNFDQGLSELQKNKWFKAAIKVGIAIGDDANKDRLANFTGSMESVLEVHNYSALRKMIKFVSVRASQIASKSVQVNMVKPLIPAGSAAEPAAGEEAAAAAKPNTETQTVKQAALNQQLTEMQKAFAGAGDDEW